MNWENQIQQNQRTLAPFKEFIQDYIDAGQMIKAPPAPSDSSLSYYIPYHIIDKKKFRVVFDASCTASTGVSINDQQLSGPKMQADLCETLLLFRTFRFALTADTFKMYRQINVHPSQWDLQRIFYRASSGEPITEYWITRVIWGFESAGFNAWGPYTNVPRTRNTNFHWQRRLPSQTSMWTIY